MRAYFTALTMDVFTGFCPIRFLDILSSPPCYKMGGNTLYFKNPVDLKGSKVFFYKFMHEIPLGSCFAVLNYCKATFFECLLRKIGVGSKKFIF